VRQIRGIAGEQYGEWVPEVCGFEMIVILSLFFSVVIQLEDFEGRSGWERSEGGGDRVHVGEVINLHFQSAPAIDVRGYDGDDMCYVIE
jgi:hypothetical protein